MTFPMMAQLLNGSTIFMGSGLVPADDFQVYIVGADPSGVSYSRYFPQQFQPTIVQVSSDPSQELIAGTTTTYGFQVTNQGGAADSFSFSVQDQNGYATQLSQGSALLSSGQTVNVSVQVQTPSTAIEGTSDELTFTATSSSTTQSNAANLTIIVVNRPLVVGSEPGPGHPDERTNRAGRCQPRLRFRDADCECDRQ